MAVGLGAKGGFKFKKKKKKTGGAPNLPGSSKPKPKPPSGGGGSPSGGGNYSSGGGSSSGGGGGGGAGLSEYIQDYRLKFFKGGKPPAGLLKRAKDNNWRMAYFEQQVRLHDPRYWRSLEARVLLGTFNQTMKVLFPNLADRTKQAQLMKSSFYKQAALWYLKNGIGLTKGGEQLLFNRITNTKPWRAQNPYWKDYIKNRSLDVQATANPLVYKQLQSEMKASFESMGLTTLPEDYYRTFFQSRYASESGFKDMQTNLKTLAEGIGAQTWWQGRPMDTGQIKTAALEAGAPGTELRTRLQRSLGVEKSFKGGGLQPFETALSKQGKLVKPLI